MEPSERIRSDLTEAMRAGEKERVGALRMLLSELQKDGKEGPGDQQAVLRRERKRRLEASETFREAGRDELAAHEDFEAQIITTYLPAELSDDELAELVRTAVADSGASSPKEMGNAMRAAMQAVGDRADGKRVSAIVKAALTA